MNNDFLNDNMYLFERIIVKNRLKVQKNIQFVYIIIYISISSSSKNLMLNVQHHLDPVQSLKLKSIVNMILRK